MPRWSACTPGRAGVSVNHATPTQAQRLVVLGMGKLGGRELSFSSDIDLSSFPRQKGQTDGARAKSPTEEFSADSGSLDQSAGQPTADGFVFRVDIRLRPFSDSGPLAISFAAFGDYYQNHGRDWGVTP